MKAGIKNTGRIILKVSLWLSMGILGLIILGTLVFSIPSVQQKIAEIAIQKVEEKTGAKIELEAIRIKLPGAVSIKNLFALGSKGDTLIDAGYVSAELSLTALIRKEIKIRNVNIENTHIELMRFSPDSTFNFSHLIPESGEKKKKKQEGNFSFSIGEIHIENTDFSFSDQLSGNNYQVNIGLFEVEMDKVNPKKKLFIVDEVKLENSGILLETRSKTNSEPKPIAFSVGLDKTLTLENVDFQLTDYFGGQEVEVKHANIAVKANELKLTEYLIDLKEIELTGTSVAFTKMNISTSDSIRIEEFKQNKYQQKFEWNISADEIDFEGNSFAFKDKSKVAKKGGMNFADLELTDISLNLENNKLSRYYLNTVINTVSLSEKSGISLHNLEGEFTFDNQKTTFENVQISAGKSEINTSLFLKYSDVESLRSSPERTSFNAKLSGVEVAVADILFFQPSLAEQIPLFKQESEVIFLNGQVQGKVNQVNVDNFNLALGNTFLEVRGQVNNILDQQLTQLDLTLDTLKTTRQNLKKYLGDSIIPPSLNLPEQIALNAGFKGSPASFNAEAHLISSLGDASMDIYYGNGYTARGTPVKLVADITDFDVGELLAIDTLGSTTLKIQGEGIVDTTNLKNSIGNFEIEVSDTEFRGYTYSQLTINGEMRQDTLQANLQMVDSNIVFMADSRVALHDSIPEYRLNLSLKAADLNDLKLSASALSVRGNLMVDFSGNNADNIDGNVEIKNLFVLKNGQPYSMNALTAELKNTPDSTLLYLQSDPLLVDYKGTVKASEFGRVMKGYFDGYFSLLPDTNNVAFTKEEYQLQVEIRNSDMLSELLLPGLSGFVPATIESHFIGDKKEFAFHADFPYLKYKGNTIDSLGFTIESSDTGSLDYSIHHKQLASSPLVVPASSVKGMIGNNQIDFEIYVEGTGKSSKYDIDGTIKKLQNGVSLHFRSDSLLVNNTNFHLPENNQIKITDSSVHFQGINFKSGEQSLMVSLTDSSAIGEAYQIKLSGFALSNFIGIFEAKRNVADGVLNGEILLDRTSGENIFSTDLTLSSLELLNDTIFNRIELLVNNREKDRISVDADFSGKENNMNVSGYISTSDSAQADMTMKITKLNLGQFEAFLTDQFDEFTGLATADISLRGNLNRPDIEGKIRLQNAVIIPTILSTKLYVEDASIEMYNRELRFKDFEVVDVNNNEATIEGTIDLADYNNPDLDITYDSDNFLYMKSTYKENDMAYGTLIADIHANVTGRLASPRVDVEANIDGGSDIHIVIPGLNTASVEKEGVVKFVNDNDTLWQQIMDQSQSMADTLAKAINKSMTLTTNLSIDKGTKITIVVDPATGEELIINGTANLSLSMSGGGSPTLTGRFEISEGSYTLTLYEVLRRDFKIKENSYLQWNGDITNAQTDITAIYEVRTSPLPLVTNETAGLQESTMDAYENNIPFEVELNIRGMLLQPEIDFDISTPPSQTDALVEAKLNRLNQNETEVNKQVFSLLLFNAFMQSSTTTESSAAYELNATARTSVSRLLTHQLNSFAEERIKGVDVDVAVNSYYQRAGDEASGKTEVSLDVSKSLLNDRLSVSLGGDFNVEGPENSRQDDMSSIAGDVMVEYKLDEDGTYLLRGFNKTEYEDILDGEVNKTGASIIFNKDFYKFSNLFQNSNDKTRKP